MPRKKTTPTSTPVPAITAAPVTHATTELDDGFPELLQAVRARFQRLVIDAAPPRLFRADVAGLFELFLQKLPSSWRQHYTCNACRDFIERYGGLVVVSATGVATSVMWDDMVPAERFNDAIGALRQAVHAAPVAGVFLSPDKMWGQPVTGKWHHFAVEPPAGMVFNHGLTRHDKESAEKFRERQLAVADAAMAGVREEYLMLSRGLGEFPLDICRKAAAMLRGGQLDRSEKCEGVADWLVDLQQRLDGERNRRCREGMVWLAAATAPTGYCHVRSGLIGTLLEDIQAEVPFVDLKARFNAKVHPLKYQRPTAAPKAGAIAQAERLFEELKTAGALDRRFAKFSDVQKLLWMPRAATAKKKDGLFGHLKKDAAPAAPVDTGSQTITWVKFRDTVLPGAVRILHRVGTGNGNYAALTAATDPESPPILQWDQPEARNTVGSYCYSGGSSPRQWNLAPATLVEVIGICQQPHQWNPSLKMTHQGDGIFFLLKGCHDAGRRLEQGGGGLFVETLKSEYHGVRSVLEAHFAQAPIAEHAEEHACGLALSSNTRSCAHVFQVDSQDGLRTTYKIDRWD